jgi:hypothetical protein
LPPVLRDERAQAVVGNDQEVSMRYLSTASVCFLCLSFTLAKGQQDHPNLSGKWQTNASRSTLRSGKPAVARLTIEQKAASIHLVFTMNDEGKESVVEFTCSTDGKDCDVQGEKISLWYSGPSLVEMDIGKETTTKSTMKIDEDGKSMTIDVAHITPTAEADRLVLEKK